MEIKVRFQGQEQTVEVEREQNVLMAVRKAKEQGLPIPEQWGAQYGNHILLKTHFLGVVGIKEGDVIDIAATQN
ncbi:MAG: hypothetical protein HY326_06045 [Chloroflexi bacterium]|nr:hypothetical protein [Chloroflexota bacterium]